MYTIFKNDTSIFLTDNRNVLSEEGSYQWKEWMGNNQLNSLLSNDYDIIYLFDEDLESMWSAFKDKFILIEASGGIVKNSLDQVLFIFRHDKWDLPKGKIEINESQEDAAIREVKEECGFVSLQLGKYIGATYHIYSENELDILKASYWYEMFSDDTELNPQTEEGITELKWVGPKDINSVLQDSYPNIILLTNMYHEGSR